jgi:hypothetical protein
MFIGNIFHYGLGPCVRNLFSNHSLSHRVAVLEVIFGSPSAFLQWKHGAVIERWYTVFTHRGGGQTYTMLRWQRNPSKMGIWWFRTPSGTSGNDSVSVAIRFHWEYFPLWIRSACLQFVFESPAFWLRSGPGNRRIPILFTGNIFHYGFDPRVCNLFLNRPHSDCVASYCVIFGALQAFLQRNHGAVIERRQSVLERVGGWRTIFHMCFETNVNSPVMLAVNWHWPLSSNRSKMGISHTKHWNSV